MKFYEHIGLAAARNTIQTVRAAMGLVFQVSVVLCTISMGTAARAVVLQMAPLEFSNRAACANFSTKPARSAFLQIDGFSAGKAGYATGLIAQRHTPSEDPTKWAAQSVKDFRLLSSHLAVSVLEALLEGRLPLISPDTTVAPAAIQKAVESCLSKKDNLSCPAMNNLLSEYWARSKMSNPTWQDLGLSAGDFFPARLREHAAIGCHVVRKFSAFHSPLQTQTIEDGTISNIAIDAMTPEASLDSCFSTTEGTDPRFTTLQLDVANLSNDLDWDSYGFKFWHSFKLFLSWGWRNAPEIQREFGRMQQPFGSLALEDSVMVLPNGCRSIELPRCDSNGLASDAMRAAKSLGATDPAMGELPQKPIDMLFSGGAGPVNNDSIGLFKADNASAWSRDFRDKLSGLHFELMRKLNTSVAKLQLITSLVDVAALSKDLTAVWDDPNYDKIEPYLACMEYSLAKNQLFDDIYQEINTLKDTQELQNVLLADSGKDLEKFIGFYKSLNDTMTPLCKKLEESQNRITKPDPDLFKALNEWAFDMLRPNERSSYAGLCFTTPGSPSCPKNQDKTYLVARPKLSGGTTGDPVTICKTSLECARTVLQSLVSVVSVRRYAHAFLPLNDAIQSPDLFNSYAAPTACKLYDPFSKQRNSWKLFLADLGSAVIYGASCGVANFRVLDLPADKVIGYNELYKQDEVIYQARTKKTELKYLAALDYAFLPALSCGVTVSNVIANSNGQYLPSGNMAFVSLRECTGSSHTEYQVDPNVKLNSAFHGATEINNTTTQACFNCALNINNIAASGATWGCLVPGVGQAIAGGVGLFQAIFRLVSNLQDPNDIVRSKVLNVDQISQSFQNTGKITRSCHNKLKKGVTCEPPKL